MVKKTTIILFAFLFTTLFLNIASAIETPIRIKTLPNHEVSVFVLDAGKAYYLIESHHETSDSNGDLLINSNPDRAKIDIMVQIKKAGIKILNDRYEDYASGSEIKIVIPESADDEEEEAATETVEEETTTLETEEETTEDALEENLALEETTTDETTENTEETQQADAGITGNAVTDTTGSGMSQNLIYALVGIIAVAALATIFIFQHRKKTAPTYNEKQVKAELTDKQEKKAKTQLKDDGAPSNSAEIIADLEGKINAAQKQLNQLKNEQRIKDAEARIKKDQEELEKLRRGEI